MDDKTYDDTWSTEKEALLTVTNLKLAVEDINSISKLVSDNSHNQQFVREISGIMPPFMENIRAMLHVTTNQCVQGIVNIFITHITHNKVNSFSFYHLRMQIS